MVAAINRRRGFRGIRLQNPFTLKVGQVFTAFGFGCDIGIGVGRPINLGAIPMVGQVMSATRGAIPMVGQVMSATRGAIPMVGQVMSATRGAIPMVGQVMSATRGAIPMVGQVMSATDAFSGVSRYANGALRELGAKSIEAGIGCGVGLGHGFGAGLAVKPGVVVHKIQCCLIETMAKLMMKFGLAPSLPFSEGSFPVSLQSGLTTTNEPFQNPFGNMKQIMSNLEDPTSQGLPGPGIMSRGSGYEKHSSKYPTETSFGTRTEKVLNSFLQNPALKEEETNLNELAGRLRTEIDMLQLVLKHHQIIEELMEKNQKLHQVLMEDLKIPPSKLQTSYSSRVKSPCSECFHCRRKQRKNRR